MYIVNVDVDVMNRIIGLVFDYLVLGIVFVSCQFNQRSQYVISNTDTMFYCSCDSTLYQTIYDFIEENDSVAKIEKINILGVYEARREDDIWIDLVGAPAYSYRWWTDDSLIVSHTIIHDWMIVLALSPEVFNKYKASFTFVDPNQFSEYQKHYEGPFEPVSWRYILRNDSLVFVKRVRH